MTVPAHTVLIDLTRILQRWSDLGWLRRLDSALASFVSQRDPDATKVLIVASAVLAHLEGRGHTCLPLSGLAASPRELLAWPAASHDEIDAVWRRLPTDTAGWVEVLQSSRLVRQALDDGGPAGWCARRWTMAGQRIPTRASRWCWAAPGRCRCST